MFTISQAWRQWIVLQLCVVAWPLNESEAGVNFYSKASRLFLETPENFSSPKSHS